MAVYRNGIMGPFNGKVGTVVGYMWNGKCCMRAYNRNVKNPGTEAQQEHRPTGCRRRLPMPGSCCFG